MPVKYKMNAPNRNICMRMDIDISPNNVNVRSNAHFVVKQPLPAADKMTEVLHFYREA